LPAIKVPLLTSSFTVEESVNSDAMPNILEIGLPLFTEFKPLIEL